GRFSRFQFSDFAIEKSRISLVCCTLLSCNLLSCTLLSCTLLSDDAGRFRNNSVYVGQRHENYQCRDALPKHISGAEKNGSILPRRANESNANQSKELTCLISVLEE